MESSDFFAMNTRETVAIRNENHEANKQVELEEVQFLPQGVDDQNSLPRNVD